jgi:hypothetical protein
MGGGMSSTVHTDGNTNRVESTHETLSDAIKKAAQLVASGKTSVQIVVRENAPAPPANEEGSGSDTEA